MAQPGQNPGQFNGPPQGQMGHYGIGDFSRSQGLTARPYAPPSAPPQQQSKGPSGPGAQPPTSVGSQPPQQSKGPGAPGAAPGSGLAQPDVMRRPGTGGGDVNDIMRIPAALPGTGGVYPQAQPASNVGAPPANAPVRNEQERVARYYDDAQIQRNFDTLFAQDPNMAMAYTEADPRTQQWRMKNQDAIQQRFGPREADGGSPLGYRQWVNHNLAGNDIGLWRSQPEQWANMRRLHGFTSDPNNAGLGLPEWQVRK